MAILKCKMCGGDLTLLDNKSVCVCEYCGTEQTVPKADDEKKIKLFERANRLRMACEFDKAYGVYEAIADEFSAEAEAYWGLVLCKYGIEYVDDPKTGNKIPTCHRSSFDSIFDDSDFEQALENADVLAKNVYRAEAKVIEEIRKGIIEISAKEEPYDIFICYKETDENGDRTIDSVLAQDVYGALTEKGYKVFFARITLEDKLGQEYEPYIFSALHSSKVMLVFGTDYNYFNAVWVKNEWSRFLKQIEAGEKKTLIPCYKGIDAYDMPKEFGKLQAQDMGKVGAIQDLIRGVEKILGTKKASAPTPSSSLSSFAEPLVERGNSFLREKSFEKANEFFDKALDYDPKNAPALLGKLLTEYRLTSLEELGKSATPIDDSVAFVKVLSVCDEKTKKELIEAREQIKERMLNKATLCLNEKRWQEAINYANVILSVNKDSVPALTVKFLADVKATSIEDLANLSEPYDCPELRALLKLCDSDMKQRIENACGKIDANISAKKKAEEEAKKKAEEEAKKKAEEEAKKKARRKRAIILSFVCLALVVIGSIVGVSIYKATDSYIFGLEYDSDLNGYIVTEYNGDDTEIVIPSDLDIVAIGDYAFEYCSSLTITLPEGITSIGEYAFCDCSSLSSITLPDSITSIGKYTFAGCSRLTSITLPEGITSIGNCAFYNCSSLSSITLPEGITSIGNCDFYNCSSLTSITLPEGITSIGYDAFRGCSSLTSITLPEGITSIGSSAFSGCSRLSSITLPEGITSIDEYAFSGCLSLTSITLPEGITSIGDNAFYNCSSLTSITLPEGITSIGNSAFENCSSLKSITLPKSLTSVSGDSFKGCSNIKTLTVSFANISSLSFITDYCELETIIVTDCDKIPDSAFEYFSSLTSITLPEGITSIGSFAFYDCSSLTSITLPEGITSIGSSAFRGCSSLSSITLPEGITSIGSYAFSRCSSLTSITLPEGITSIGNDTFYNCSSLTSITLPEGITSIGYDAFYNCSSLTSITLPEGITSIGWGAFSCCSSLTIYCQAESEPSGWSVNWNSGYRPVVWGYKN